MPNAFSRLHSQVVSKPYSITEEVEPSAEIIQPIYVNEYTNSTSPPSMLIGVVTAEEGDIIMALFLVQLIDIPTVAASVLRMFNTDDRSSEEWENSAISSA